MRILHVSPLDSYGGAERVALTLHREFCARGQDSWLAVGRKYTHGEDGIVELPRGHTAAGRLLGSPRRFIKRVLGRVDFNFPSSRRLLDMPGSLLQRPDIVHCHNLHGGFFDLRALPELSRQVPTVLMLHDMWLFSGRCSFPLTFQCEDWQAGCNRCRMGWPQTLWFRRRGTAWNWRVKRAIFAQSRFHVTAPCAWVMKQVERSLLAPSVASSRIIHNSVDTSVFTPGDRQEARRRLELPADAVVLLGIAKQIRTNPCKDFATMHRAAVIVAEQLGCAPVLMLAIGGDADPPIRAGSLEIRFVPSFHDDDLLAAYYRAADVFIHGAWADTFPLVVLEAMASGLPTVASAVAGIPEQIRHGDTGLLVPAGDAPAMAESILRILRDARLADELARNGVQDCRQRFSLTGQVDAFLAWYREILGSC